MHARAHSLGGLFTALALVWMAGCISSPELKKARELEEQGDLEEARKYYTTALDYGLRDPEEQRQAEARLKAIEAELTGIESDAKQSELASTDAALDERARSLYKELESRRCDRQKLALLGTLLTGPHQDAFTNKVATDFESCLVELSADPMMYGVIMASLTQIETSGSKKSARMKSAFSSALYKHLEALAAKPKLTTKPSSPSLIAVMSQDDGWKNLPDKNRLEKAYDKALAAHTAALTASSALAADRCRQGMDGGVDAPQLKEATAKACREAFDQNFAQITAIPVTIEDTRRAVSAIEKLASKLPLEQSSLAKLDARQKMYADVWRERAAKSSGKYAKAYYLAIADGLDGKSTSRSSRDALKEAARAYDPLPARGQLNSAPPCASIARASLSKVSNIGLSTSRASSSIDLDVDACKRDVTIKRKKDGAFSVTEKGKCQEVRSWTPGGVSQECRSGDVVDSRGRIRKDSCAHKVAVTYPGKTKTSTVCAETSTRFQRYEVTWCADLELRARAKLTSYDGKTPTTSTLAPLRYKECKSWTEVLPASQAPDDGPLRADLNAWIDAGFGRYLDQVLVPVHATSITRAKERRATLRRDAIARARREMQSSALDARVEGAMLYTIANSSPPHAEFSLPTEVRNLTPSRRIARPFAQGKPARKLETTSFESAWEKSRTKVTLAKPHAPRKTDGFASYIDAIERRNILEGEEVGPGSTARTKQALWLSTGRLTTARRGPTLTYKSRVSDTSFWIVQGSASVGSNLVLDQTDLETMWLVGASIGGLYLGGGGRVMPGDTRGGRAEVRWLGGPRPGRGPLDPGITWSAGALLDWVMLTNNTRSFGLRLPVEMNIPVARRISIDAGVEPDLFQFLSPDVDTRYAHSDAWVGATLYLLQSRLTLHADAGPQISDARVEPLTWRANMSIRF